MKTLRTLSYALFIGAALLIISSNAHSNNPAKKTNHDERVQRSDLAQILQESKAGIPYTLNLANHIHYRHLVNQLKNAGRTPKNSPQLYKSIARTKKAHKKAPPVQQDYAMLAASSSAPESINAIVQLGRSSTSGYSYTAKLLSTVPDGTVSTNLSLQLFDNTTKSSIGQLASNQQYGDGTDATVEASGTWGSTPTNSDEVLASGTVSLQPHSGSPVFLNVHNTVLALEIPRTPPTVDKPKQKPNRTVDYILTCLQRSPGNTADCDYGPYSGSGRNAQFPMKGSVEYMSAVPTTLSADNAEVDFIIWDDSAGGGCTLGETSSNILSNFSTTGNTVSWDFENANFGQACFKRLTRVDMSFTIAVKTATSGNDKVPAYVTTQSGGAPFDTNVMDHYLEFSWGCLTPDTKILMADGSTKKIKHVKVGEMVISNQDKQPRKIIHTIKGIEDDDIYVVTDNKKNKVRMTAGHPVLTQGNEVKLARQLVVGDKIYSAEGPVKIKEIKKKKYQGDVWNLVLDNTSPSSNKSTNFYANGMMVGDNKMQEHWGEYYEQHHNDILERIPKEWHKDYHNWKKTQSK